MAHGFPLARRQFLLTSASLASTLTFGQIALADGAELAVIVNGANKERLTAADIEQIYRSSRRYWPGGKPIVALNLATGSVERAAFDRAVLRLDPEGVGRYWIDRRIRGGEPAPRSVPNASLVAGLVAQLGNGIGYVPAALVATGVRVIARVRGRELVTTARSLQDLVEIA